MPSPAELDDEAVSSQERDQQPPLENQLKPDGGCRARLDALRRDTVGHGAFVTTPFGTQRLCYADWAASGRSLHSVESFLLRSVLPLHGNTHSAGSATGFACSSFLDEARRGVGAAVNARLDHADAASDVVLFIGSGATSATAALVHLLGLSRPLPPGAPLCDTPVVLTGPFEHHSNLLPWRESSAQVVRVPSRSDGVGLCREALAAALSALRVRPLVVASFSAASNVTGVVQPDIDAITAQCSAAGCLAVWDYAGASTGLACDMNASGAPKDAVFLSPHKLAGGPGSCGVLVIKRRLLDRSAAPLLPGGGSVAFVTDCSHTFAKRAEEREQGGSPDVPNACRAALALRARARLGGGGDALLKAARRVASSMHARLAAVGPCLVLLGPPHPAPGASTDINESRGGGGGAGARLPTASFLIRAPIGGNASSSTSPSPGSWLHHGFVVALLSDVFGIACRGGCACAGPFGLRLLGIGSHHADRLEAALAATAGWAEAARPGWTRVSLAPFASDEEINFVCSAILLVAEHGWRLLPQYRVHAATGLWKHASRMAREPARAWLGRCPLPGDNAADGDASASQVPHNRAMTAAEEDVLHADWSACLSRAEALFASAGRKPSPAAALSSAHIATSGGSGGGGGGGGGAEEEEEALRWFALPSEAAAALERERSGSGSSTGPAYDLSLPSDGLVRPPPPWRVLSGSSAAGAEPAEPDASVVVARNLADVWEQIAALAHRGGGDGSSAHRGLGDRPARRDAAETAPRWSDAAALAARRPGAARAPAPPPSPSPPPPPPPSPPPLPPSSLLAAADDDSDDEARPRSPPVSAPLPPRRLPSALPAPRRAAPTPKLLACVARAVAQWGMIRPGERILLGLSGGKDSLSLLHCLLALQSKSPVKFEVGAATVDPGAETFDPRPLIVYCSALGVPHFYLSNTIMADAASGSLGGDSICSFCARMKRGALYSCARAHGYTSLALGQHADDMAESLLMSAFHNGQLRTMKARYEAGGEPALRVIRPLALAREAATAAFAASAALPVVPDGCPACFEAPKERQRVRALLRREEAAFPRLFHNLCAAMAPLLDERVPPLLAAVAGATAARRNANSRRCAAAAASAPAEPADAETHCTGAPLAPPVSLRDASDAQLCKELRSRGGLAAGPAGSGTASREEEEAEETAEGGRDTGGGGVCRISPRAPPRALV